MKDTTIIKFREFRRMIDAEVDSGKYRMIFYGEVEDEAGNLYAVYKDELTGNKYGLRRGKGVKMTVPYRDKW